MKISIITPVFNAAKYIPKTVSCMLSQTYTDWEWICVDDGSNDNSLMMLQEAADKDPRIKVIHQENGGVSKARNTGLASVTGEWIAFLDADDEVTPNWLQSYAEAITDDVDIIFQGAKIITNKEDHFYRLGDAVLNVTEIIYEWQEHHHDMGSAWSKCIRKSVITNNGVHFSENINNFEDWVFLISVLVYAHKCKTISATEYIYNRQNSTITAKGQKRRSAEATYAITTEWYKAMQPLKVKALTGYNLLLQRNSVLQVQTIMEYYRRKDISRKKRLHLLAEFSNNDFILKECKISQHITNLLYFRNFPFLSDLILRLWRFV